MDRKISKISVDIQSDPKRSFAASPEDQKLQGFPKFYLKICLKFDFDEVATEYK